MSKENHRKFLHPVFFLEFVLLNFFHFSTLGATKVSGKDFLAIVTDRAEILRDGLEEGQDPSFWIIFQMMVRGALSKIDFSANARR